MGSLRKCLNAATRFERGLKRGILDRAKQIAIDQNVDRQTAEVMAVKEAQSTAARDLKAVKQAMAPRVAPTPGRGAAVQAKVQQMMSLPEKRTGILQRMRDRVVGLIAMNEAKAPSKKSPAKDRQALEQTRQETAANLHAEEQALLQQAEARLNEKHGFQAEQARAAIAAATTKKDIARAEAEFRRVERDAIREKEATLKDIQQRYAEKRAAEERTFAEQERVINARERLGESEARRQNLLRGIAEYNAILRMLPPDMRGRVGGLGQLAHIGNTEEALTNFLTGQLSRVGEVIETMLQREFQGRINDLVKTYKPKKTPGGVVTTRIGDAQEVVNEIKRVSKLDHEQVSAEQADVERILADPNVSPEDQSRAQMKHNVLQLYGDLKNRSAAELEVAYETLQTTIQDGRSAWGAKEEARLVGYQALRDEATTTLGQRDPSEVDAAMKKAGILHRLYAGMMNWGQLLETVFGENSRIAQKWTADERRASNQKRDYVRDGTDKFHEMLKTAIGKNSVVAEGKAIDALQKANIVVPNLNKPISKLNALYYRMAWEQADVRTRMINQGWTQETMDTLNDATNDNVSQAVYGFLRAEYERIYKEVDAVYHRTNGMHLPKIQFYAPMRYEFAGADDAHDPFSGTAMASGNTAGFTIGRISHNAPIKQADAMTVYLQHLAQAGQYIYASEMVREIRGVLNDPEVKKSVKANMGRASQEFVNWIDSIAQDGRNKAIDAGATAELAKRASSAFAIAALAGNVRTILMQTEGIIRFMAAMPIRQSVSTLLDPSFYGNIPTMWKSDTIQRRIKEGMNPVTQMLLDQGRLNPSLLSELNRLSLTPMILADAAATSTFSAAVYTAALKDARASGVSEAEAHAIAADAAEAAVYEYAQPISTGSRRGMEIQLSRTAIGKMMAIFMTEPFMKAGTAVKGMHEVVHGIKDGNMDLAGSGGRKIGMVMLGGLFTQLMSSIYKDVATDDDDDDIWTLGNFGFAAVTAPFQGWFLVGTIASDLTAKLLGMKGRFRTTDPLSDAKDRLLRAYKNWDNLWSEDPEKVVREVDDLIKALGVITTTTTGINIGGLSTATNLAKPVVGAYKNLQKTED